jgi:hypothetical protein
MLRARFIVFLVCVSSPVTSVQAAPDDSRSRDVLVSLCRRIARTADDEIKRDCKPYLDAGKASALQRVEPPQGGRVQSPFVKAPTFTATPKPTQDASSDTIPGTKRVFIRSDPIDNFWYSVAPPGDIAGAKGASVSYTNDHIAQTQTATVNGELSYLLIPPRASDLDTWGDFALATWVAGDGTWHEPLKKPENTALKAGFDGQLRLREHDPLSSSPNRYWDNYFSVSPYLQTDFRQKERAGGVNVAWEPVIPEFNLGAAKANPYYLAFWIFRPEADFRQVTDPGFTNQVKGSYAWLGYTARGNFQLLPLPTGNRWMDQWLVNRFALIGTAQYFWDAHSSTAVRYYTAQLQYNFGLCAFPTDPEPGVNSDCKIAGGSSIVFEYDWGIDKDTLVNINQYLVKFAIKY